MDFIFDIVKASQTYLQAIAKLNTDALQNISFLKPEQLAQMQKPNQLVQAHLNVFIDNGRKGLDYAKQSFEIFEKAVLSVTDNRSDKTALDK